MCHDKRHWVAEKQFIPDLGIYFRSPSKPPSYHLYYICNITTPQAWAFLQTLQCTGWVYPGNIIMLLQGHL